MLGAAGGGPSGARKQQLAPNEDNLVLAEVVRHLVEEFHPQRVYLFGSWACGDARDDNDYDLMLVVEKRAGAPWDMERLAYDVLSGLSISKDGRRHDQRLLRLDAWGRCFAAFYSQARGSPAVCSVKTRGRTLPGSG